MPYVCVSPRTQESSQRYEVDFVVKSGQKITELIQVSWNVSDEATQRHEERALWCAMEELEFDSGIILTEDYEKSLEQNGKIIKYLPMWKWLLAPEKYSKERNFPRALKRTGQAGRFVGI
jgi:predicted AAA+ superfamily ATPase